MAGKPAARLGDMTSHGGTITGPGVPTVLIGKMPAATMGDMHVCPMMIPGTPPIPHVGGPIILGSTGVFIGKKPAARMGDKVVCGLPPSSIILGCMTVLIGDSKKGSKAGSAASAAAAKAKGVKGPGALKAMEVPKPAESKIEAHTIKMVFKDIVGKLLKKRVFRLKDPNGSEVLAASDAEGGYLREGYAQSGSYTATLLDVTDAKCDKSSMKGGDSCTVKAKAVGYADGDDAMLYISLVDAEGQAEDFDRAVGKVQGENVEIPWSLDAQKLKSRIQARHQKPPVVDLVFQVVVGFQCATAKVVKIEDEAVQGKIYLDFVEVPDILFHHDGAIPCLDTKDYLVGAIATTIHHANTHSEQELIVFGHADTTGKVRYNYALSEQRANAVKSLLAQDVDTWIAIAKQKAKVEDYQCMLKVLTERHGWACDPGKLDGKDGPKTQGAVKAFQRQTNARYKLTLAEDGVIGPRTWGALHRVLCGLVAKSLGVADPATRDYPQWHIPRIGCVSDNGCFACGESFPIEEAEKDNYKSEKNRRVELVFLPRGLFHQEPHANRDQRIDKKTWPLTSRTRVVQNVLASTPLPWDCITVGNVFWEFFQTNMPHLDDADKFHGMLQLIYGREIDRITSDSLLTDLKNRNVSAPIYQVSHTMDVQQLGAYLDSTIYLNRQLVVDANANPLSRWLLLMAMVHEAGHYLDDLVRNKYSLIGGDSFGEEGAGLAQYFMTQDGLKLFEIDQDFADVKYASCFDESSAMEFVIKLSNLDEEKRASAYWQYMQSLGKESGEHTDVSGKVIEVEFWSITGKGGVHEEITKKAAIAAGYKVPPTVVEGDSVTTAEWQFHTTEYCWDAHLYQGCAWPDVPYQSNSDAATTNYKNMLSMAAAHGSGWHWHDNWAYKSHYGEWQHWHSMCPSNGSQTFSNLEVKNLIISKFKDWYGRAMASRSQGLPGKGLVNIGKMLHTIQDSYCHSHCWRRYVGDENAAEFWNGLSNALTGNSIAYQAVDSAYHGAIWTFQGYTNQQATIPDDLHKLADQSYSLGYDRAVKACTEILAHYKNGSSWETVSQYLETVVYRLHPSRVNSIAGESHPWFKKRLTEAQEPDEDIRENDKDSHRSAEKIKSRLVTLRKKIEQFDSGGSAQTPIDTGLLFDPYGEHVCHG